jgi:hypothetical protein
MLFWYPVLFPWYISHQVRTRMHSMWEEYSPILYPQKIVLQSLYPPSQMQTYARKTFRRHLTICSIVDSKIVSSGL